MGTSNRSARRLVSGLALVACSAAPLLAQPAPQAEGASELALALRRLGTTHRVLMVGAHPDDENTAVLAELALGQGADVAYLSLTRGEGGQNLLGPELQEGLGLIRTEELLSARRLDGARQFFTRAYDFGYSKSAEEAFRQWPRDTVLADVVAVVRRFRPDVIVAVFSGTPRDGHGQHQVSGILAREAFTAAADPTRFPEQIREGLPPHRTAYLFQSRFFGSEGGDLGLDTGEYDPVLGRSRFQVAMASRSRHRSQDMGMAQPAGPQRTSLFRVAGAIPENAASIFAGLDSTLLQRAWSANAPEDALGAIADYQRQVDAARTAFNPFRTDALVTPLAGAVAALDAVLLRLDEEEQLFFHLAAERAQAVDALRRATGLVFDVTADRQRVVPGGALIVTANVWNGGRTGVRVESIRPDLPPGWTVEGEPDTPFDLRPGTLERRQFHIRVPADAVPTEPYFLRASRAGALYAWPDDPTVRGLPFEPSPLRIAAAVAVDGARLGLEEEASFVEVDKSLGELRYPVFITPAVSLAVSPQTVILPLGSPATTPPPELIVHATAQEAGLAGTVSLRLPAGWRSDPASADVRFDQAGDRRSVRFRVIPPADASPRDVRVTAVLQTASGRTFTRGYSVIAYPHTRPRTLFEPATVRIASFPVSLAEGLRVGIIEGAGDGAAQALAQMGAEVVPLDAEQLTRSDLSRLHAIVAGIRAYEVRPDLIANNARLLDWVRAGGTLVIQYNKYELVEGNFAPFPLTMARPHGRVADESAPVRLLRPEHPALSWPNRIGPQDFAGWVHERGLYFADTWDERYVPLLALSDPGEDPLHGSLLVAPVGSGYYVYTGLALFRQWPEAVPGAYRLLANLVSLGRAPR